MDIVTTGLRTWKWLRIHWAIRDIDWGTLEILLVVIQLGVTEPRKTGFVCLLDFFFIVQNHPCFSVNDLQLATLTHLNNKPVFTIYFAGWYSFLYFTNIPSICIFILFCVFIFNAHLVFLWATMVISQQPESCFIFSRFLGLKIA